MDLTNLSIEQLQALRHQLDSLTDTSGRSPLRRSRYQDARQLDDLRPLPSATDPRPTFFPSAESPRHGDLSRTSVYPRLMWHRETGREITVEDKKAQTEHETRGYVTVAPPNAETLTAEDQARQLLEQLSPEDRKTVFAAAHQSKMDRAKDLVSSLTDEERTSLLASLQPAPVAKKSA